MTIHRRLNNYYISTERKRKCKHSFSVCKKILRDYFSKLVGMNRARATFDIFVTSIYLLERPHNFYNVDRGTTGGGLRK